MQINKYMLILKPKFFSGFWEAIFEPSRVFAAGTSVISSLSSASSQSFRREGAAIPWEMQHFQWFSMPEVVEHRNYCIIVPVLPQSLDGTIGTQATSETTTFPFNKQHWMALEFPWEFCWNEIGWFVWRKMQFSLPQCPFPCRTDLA